MRYRKTTIWKEAPFIRLIIPFSAGIVIERYVRLSMDSWLPVFLLLVTAWIILSLFHLHTRYKLRWVYGLLLKGALLCTGGVLALVNDTSLSSESLTRHYKKGDRLILKLVEPLTETKATYKTIATVSHLARGDSCIRVVGKIILYFRKDSVTANLDYGKELIVFSTAQQVLNTGNPGSFDFASYAKLQGITMQVFVAPRDYLVTADSKGNHFKAWLLDSRKLICGILKKNIPGTKEAGLAEALLVGYKEDLDKELLQVYSNTGVVHVIAISGLHLGILYIICKGMMLLIPFFRNRKWFTSVVIIALLWIFSLLTGGSPSVLRSAVMFTAILCGESSGRKISIYNCLAASAILLLIYNPYWLFDIGFQLSYAAVLSILVFNKAIDRLLYVNNKLLDNIWQMAAVTLSAQILTTPVSLFYFQQFPNYFLLANLVAVPLSTVILIGTILLCLISLVPVIPELAGKLLSFLIRLMNDGVAHINNLPFSITTGINISLWHALLLYCFIASLSMYLIFKRKTVLYTALLVLLMIVSVNLFRQLDIRQREMVIVYNIKGRQVFELIAGRSGLVAGIHASCIENECRQIIRAAHTRFGITNSGTIAVPQVVKGKKKTVWFLNSATDPGIDSIGAILIISPTVSSNAETILIQLRPLYVVLDAAHSAMSVRNWEEACIKHHIPYHSVTRKGAFVMTLN